MRSCSQLLADVSSIQRCAEVVHNPICAEALHTFVCIARECEFEVPLMVTGVDFVRLALVAICGKEVQGLVEESGLVHDRLGRYGVGRGPSI